MVTFTRAGQPALTPYHLATWSLAETPRTVVHDLIGDVPPDVSVFPAATPHGTLSLVCADAAEAAALVALYRPGLPVTLEGHPALPEGEALVHVLTAPPERRPGTGGRVQVSLTIRVVA